MDIQINNKNSQRKSKRANSTAEEIEAEFTAANITRMDGTLNWDNLPVETKHRYMMIALDSFDDYFSDDYVDEDVKE